LPSESVERILSGGQGLHEHRAAFGVEAPVDHDHPAFIPVGTQSTALMLTLRFSTLGGSVEHPPASDDPTDLLGRVGAAHREQPRFILRSRDPSQRPHLGIREVTSLQGARQDRKSPQGTGDSYAFACGHDIEAHTPGQPPRTRAEAVAQDALVVELSDEREQPGDRGIDLCREARDFITEPVHVQCVREREQCGGSRHVDLLYSRKHNRGYSPRRDARGSDDWASPNDFRHSRRRARRVG